MRSFVVSILFIAFILSAAAVEKNYNYQHFSVENGLSDNDVTQILQHSSGFIYIATQNGLNRFDGINFKKYKSISSTNGGDRLMNDYITFMSEDTENNLWLRTKDGAIYCFDVVAEYFRRLPLTDAKGNTVLSTSNKIFTLPGSDVWISTEQGIFKVSHQSILDKTFAVEFFDVRGANVVDIVEDNAQNCLILTDKGIVTYHQRTGKLSPLPQPTPNEVIHSLSVKGNNVLLGGRTGSVYRQTYAEIPAKLLAHLDNSPIGQVEILPDNKFAALSNHGLFVVGDLLDGTVLFNSQRSGFTNIGEKFFCDSLGKIWIVTKQASVLCYDLRKNQCTSYRIENSTLKQCQINDFIEIDDRRLLLKNNTGEIFCYNRQDETIQRFIDINTPGSNLLNEVKDWKMDNQNNLWFMTYASGVNKIHTDNNGFRVRTLSNSEEAMSNDIRAICQDEAGNFVIGTHEGKICVMTSDYEITGYIDRTGKIAKNALFSQYINDIILDRYNNLWVATRGEGLFRLTKNRDSYVVKHFLHNITDKYSLNSNQIFCIKTDLQGNIWIGTWGEGINKAVETDNGQFKFLNSNNEFADFPDKFKKVRDIVIDNQGVVWVAGQHCGVLRLDYKTENENRFTTFDINSTSCPLSSDDVQTLFYTRQGQLFAGTSGGGLNEFEFKDKNKLKVKYYNSSNDFPSDIIKGITQDKTGNLWIAIYNGVIKLDDKNNQLKAFKINSLNNLQIRTNVICCPITGELLMGTTHGILILDPAKSNTNTNVKLLFDRLIVDNKEVRAGDNTKILKKPLDQTRHITLTHAQSVFEIECVALDYKNPSAIQYAFMLEGIDKEWNYSGSNRTASFKGLGPGRYVLKVKSTNSDRVWQENERKIEVTVLPPFWKSTTAIILYVLFTVGLTSLIVYSMFTFYKLKSKIRMEEELTELKLDFFTNISHEIRTPLTLIHTPLEHMLSAKQLRESLWDELAIVHRNSGRLLKLINQLLDFRSLHLNKLTTRNTDIDIAQMLSNLTEDFRSTAMKHGVNIDFVSDVVSEIVYSDREKLESIFCNIISNAVKFSPQGQTVSISLTTARNNIICKIEDRGVGISDAEKESIFKPFYTVPGVNSRVQSNTGIGLALVKEYCRLLQIPLEFESSADKGTSFILRFSPKSNQTEQYIIHRNNQAQNSQDKDNNSSLSKNRINILIIEDNAELRHYMRLVLSERYNVFEADDGGQGIEVAAELLPDLIISDLMMPNTSGFEFVRSMKDNINLSHIPIIIISAKDDVESKTRLFEAGVDDYITKPFSIDLLVLRIDNILEQRKKLRLLYSSSITLPPSENTPSSIYSKHDNEIIEKITAYLNDNLTCRDITVEHLCKATGLHYYLLNNKMKHMVGLTPLEFIREFRIQRATELIREGVYSMKEITYMVGMSDSRYFSKCFKQRYGMTPTEYKQKLKNGIN